MATVQSQLVCDSSTVANFVQWGQGISNAFAALGWSKTADTGQVAWGSVSSVPAVGAYIYEIWTPNDGFTAYYLKVEYGSVTGPLPVLRISLGTGTSGTGLVAGLVAGPYALATANYGSPSTTAGFECDFSAATGRFSAMLWRNSTTTGQQFFAVERSLNSSGQYTNAYVTLFTCGSGNATGNAATRQVTVVFGIGVAPPFGDSVSQYQVGGFACRCRPSTVAGTSAFNNSIPFDTAAPLVGYFDFPCTVVGLSMQFDMAEGVTFTASLYGITHTYMPSSNGPLGLCLLNPTSSGSAAQRVALCMRYD